MPSRNATVAEAVKAALNAASAANAFAPQSFTAVRVYSPVTKVEDLKGLTVTVYAAGDEQAVLTRGKDQHDITIVVGVEHRLPAGVDPETEAANAAIDPLVLLVEQVADSFRQQDLGGAAWLETKIPVPSSADRLREHGCFLGLIQLTYRLLA